MANKSPNRPLDEQNKFSGRVLAESRLFANCAWAASVVLKPDKEYTESEAWNIVQEFLHRRVG